MLHRWGLANSCEAGDRLYQLGGIISHTIFKDDLHFLDFGYVLRSVAVNHNPVSLLSHGEGATGLPLTEKFRKLRVNCRLTQLVVISRFKICPLQSKFDAVEAIGSNRAAQLSHARSGPAGHAVYSI